MEGVELKDMQCGMTGACVNKRRRVGRDAAFADAKTAVFEAKMRKRAADDAVRGGTGDAAAAEAAAVEVESSTENAALVAAMISNKAIEKAARTANDEIAAYLNGADFKHSGNMQALTAYFGVDVCKQVPYYSDDTKVYCVTPAHSAWPF